MKIIFANKQVVLRNVLFVLCVVTVMTCQTLVQAISTPSLSPLAIMMGDSTAEKTVLGTIQKYHDDIKVAKYQSLEYAIEISRSIGQVFYIGHGSESGISTGAKEISYEKLSEIPSRNVFFLSCNSPTFYSNSEVDAVEAGIYASAAIAIQRRQESTFSLFVEDIITRQNELRSQNSQAMFLRISREGPPSSSSSNRPVFSTEEKEVRGIMLLLIVLAFFFPSVGIIFKFLRKAWQAFVAAGSGLLLLYRMMNVANGLKYGKSVLEIASDVLLVGAAIVSFAIFMLDFFDWLAKICYGALFAGDVATMSARAPAIAAMLFLVSAMLIAEVAKLIGDMNDPDSRPRA